MSLPPDVPQPVNRPDAQPATADQLQDVQREMTGFEKGTLRWAKVAVIMSGLAALFVCLQWWEMHQGGIDTHALAIAAGTQAAAASDMADAAGSQVDAADNFADSAEEINRGVAGAVDQLKAATDNARTSIKAAQEAMRLDQRAWVNFAPGAAVSLEDNRPVTVPYVVVNSGKTFARGVDGFIRIEILPRDIPPSFDYDPKHPFVWAHHFAIGALFPNFPTTLHPFWVSPNWGIGPDATHPTQGAISGTEHKQIETGDLYIATHGKFTYDDVFGIHHWVKFCGYSQANRPSGEGAKRCAEYNDADSNLKNPGKP